MFSSSSRLKLSSPTCIYGMAIAFYVIKLEGASVYLFSVSFCFAKRNFRKTITYGTVQSWRRRRTQSNQCSDGKSNGESEIFVAIGDRQLAVACVVFTFLCPRSLVGCGCGLSYCLVYNMHNFSTHIIIICTVVSLATM